MIIKRIVSITCLSIPILFASPVFAQTPPGSAPQGGESGGPQGGAAMPETKTFNVEAFIAGVDTDKDGFMTKEEFKTAGLTDRMFLTPPFCDPDHDEKIKRFNYEQFRDLIYLSS